MRDKDLSPLLDIYFNDLKNGGFNNYLLLSKISRHLVPHWFRPMLEDKTRNTFYRQMLANTVQDKIVIDLGAGTGMWAIEALNGGARFVYLVEKNPLMIKYLSVILKDHPVKIIPKPFEELTLEDFDRGIPDVLVHEVFSSTGIGEGVISAFQKIWEIFPEGSLQILPQYLWIEAKVIKVKPLELSAAEKNVLGENEDMFHELVHPFRSKPRDKIEKDLIPRMDAHELLFIDLMHVKREQKFSFSPIPIDLTPGMVHKVYVTFKFSSDIDGPFFDSFIEDHHWGGHMVEFYFSKKMQPVKKFLNLELVNNIHIENPVLKD